MICIYVYMYMCGICAYGHVWVRIGRYRFAWVRMGMYRYVMVCSRMYFDGMYGYGMYGYGMFLKKKEVTMIFQAMKDGARFYST